MCARPGVQPKPVVRPGDQAVGRKQREVVLAGDAVCLSVPGAAVPRGGADTGRAAAEVPGGAAAQARAAAGRARDRRAGAGAQHPHIPAEPGEAQRQEEEGEVQAESFEAPRRTPNQFTLRYDSSYLLPEVLVCHLESAALCRQRWGGVGDEMLTR